MPTDGSTFYLDCDVSHIGLGAVLSHNQNGSKVVIEYTSRALSKAGISDHRQVLMLATLL